MALEQLNAEQLKEMSLIEVAYELLKEKKQPASFQEILDELKAILGLTEEEVKAKIAQFYTDLNIDGRFLALGENRWGLRVWYPVDQTEEEMATKPKVKKKKAKKAVEDDLDDFEDLDEDLEFDDDILDDEDEDLDDFDEEDDDEDDDEEEIDDEDFDDEDFDEDEELLDEDLELEDEEFAESEDEDL